MSCLLVLTEVQVLPGPVTHSVASSFGNHEAPIFPTVSQEPAEEMGSRARPLEGRSSSPLSFGFKSHDSKLKRKLLQEVPRGTGYPKLRKIRKQKRKLKKGKH